MSVSELEFSIHRMTDLTKLMVAFCNLVDAPKNRLFLTISTPLFFKADFYHRSLFWCKYIKSTPTHPILIL